MCRRFTDRVSAKIVDLAPDWQLASQLWGLRVELVADDMLPNPKPSDYDGHLRVQRMLTQFDDCYHRLLVALQRTFTGTPSALDTAIGIMYELRLLAIDMAETPIADGTPVGPEALPLPRSRPCGATRADAAWVTCNNLWVPDTRPAPVICAFATADAA